MDTPKFQQDYNNPVEQVDDPEKESPKVHKDNSQVLQDDVSSDDDTLVIDIDYGGSSLEFKEDAQAEPSKLSSPTSETKTSFDENVMISSVGLKGETLTEVSSSTTLSPESPDPSPPEEAVDIDAVIDRDMKEGSNLYKCPEIKLERSNPVYINSQAPERALPLDLNIYKQPVNQSTSAANDYEETEMCPLTLYLPESPTDDYQLCASNLFSTENSYPLPTVLDKKDLAAVVDIDLNQSENIYNKCPQIEHDNNVNQNQIENLYNKCPQIGYDNNVNQTFPTASVIKNTEDHQGPDNSTNTADDVTLQAIHQVAVNILPYMKGTSNISIGEISRTIATILSSANQEDSSVEVTRMLVAETVEEKPMYNHPAQWSEHQNKNYGNVRAETVCDTPIRSVDETKVETLMKTELVNTETEIQTEGHISRDVNKPNSDLNSQFFIPTLRQQSDALYSAYTSHTNDEKTVESAEQTAAKWLGQMAQLCNLPKKQEKCDTTDYRENVQTSFNIQLPAQNHSETNWISVDNDDTKPATLLSGEDIHSSVMENLEETAFRLSNISTFSEVNHSKPEEKIHSLNTSGLGNSADEFVATKSSVTPKICSRQESLKIAYLRSPTDKSNIQVTSNLQNIQKASNELNFKTGSKVVQNEIHSSVGYQGNLIEVPLKHVIHKKKSKKSKRKKKKLDSEKTHKSKNSEKIKQNLLSKAQTLDKDLEQPLHIAKVHNEKIEPQHLSASQIEHIGEVQLQGASALVQQQSDVKSITKTLSGQNDILKWFEDMLKPKESLKQMTKSEKMKEEVVDLRYCDLQNSMEHDLYKSKESFNDLKKRSKSRERSHSKDKFSPKISRRSRERSVHKSERRSRGRYFLDSKERSSSRGRSRQCSRERSHWKSGKRSRSRSKSRLRDESTFRRSRFRSRSRSRHSTGFWKRSRSRERSSTASRKLRTRARSSIRRSRSRSRRSVGLKSRSRSRGRSLRRRSRERLSDKSVCSRSSRSLSFSLSPSPKRKRADDSMSISSLASSSTYRSRSSSKRFRGRSKSSSYRKSRGRSSSYSPGHQRRHSRTPSDKRPIYHRYSSSWRHNWRDRSRGNRSSSSSPTRSTRYDRSRSKTLSDRTKRKRSLSVKGRKTNQSSSRSCSKSRAPLGSPKRDRTRRLEISPKHQKDNNLDSKPKKSESKSRKEEFDLSRKMQKNDRQECNKSEQETEFITKATGQSREIRKDRRHSFIERRSEPNLGGHNIDQRRESQNYNKQASKESKSELESNTQNLQDRREIKKNRRQSSALNKTENIESHDSKRVNPKGNQTQLEQNKIQSDSRQVRVPGCDKLVSSLPLVLGSDTGSSKPTTDDILSEKERIFEQLCCRSPSTAAVSGGTKPVKHQRVKELSSVYTKGKVEAKTLDDLASDRARILTELNGLNSDSESVSSHVSLDDKQSSDVNMLPLLLNSPIHQQAATNEPLFEEALGVVLASPNTSRKESSGLSKIDLEDSHIPRKQWSDRVLCQASSVEQCGEQKRKKVGAAWGQIVSNIHLEKQERLKGTRVDISGVLPSVQIKEASGKILHPEQSSKSVSGLFEMECQATLAKIQKTKRKTQLEHEQLAQSEPINKWLSVFVEKDCRAFDLLLFRLCKSLGIVSSVKFSELSKKNRKRARKSAEDMSTLVNSILSSSLSKLSLPGLHWPESKGKTLSQWLALGIDSQSTLYKRILYVLCLEVSVPSYQLVASFNSVMSNKLKEYVYFLQELFTTLKPPKDLFESANSSSPEIVSCKNPKVENEVCQVLSNTSEENRIDTQTAHPGKRCKSCGRNSDILGVEYMIACLKDIKQLMNRANLFFAEYVKHMKVVLWNAKAFKSVRFNLDKVLNLLRSVNSLPLDIKKHISLLTPAAENIAKVLHMTKFLYFKKRELQIRLVISMISNSETLLVEALVEAEAEYNRGYVPKMAKCEDFKSCSECVVYLQGGQSRLQSEEFILLDPSNINQIDTNDTCVEELQPATNMETTSKESVPDNILLTFKNLHESLGGGPDDCKWRETGRFEKIPKHLLLPAEINSGVLYGGRCLYFTRNLREKVAKQLVRCKQNIMRINKCLAIAPNPDQEKAKVRMLNLRWNLLTRYTTKLCHKKYQELLQNLEKYKLCLEWHERRGFPEIEIYQTDEIATLIKTYIERISIAVEVVQEGMARLEAEKTANCEVTGAQLSDQTFELEPVKVYTPNETNLEAHSSEECNQQKVILWNNCDKAEDSNIEITYFTSDDTVLEPSTSRMFEPRMGDTRQVLAVDPTVDHFEDSNRAIATGYESRQVVYGPGNSDNPHGDVDLRLEGPPENYRTVEYPEYRENVDYFPVVRTSTLTYNTPDTMRDNVQYQENFVHNPGNTGHRGGTTVTTLAPSLSLVDGDGNLIHTNSRGFDERLSWEPNSPLSWKISTQESFLNNDCFDDSIYKEFNVSPGKQCEITSHLGQETCDQRPTRVQSNIIEEFIGTKLYNFNVKESKCSTTTVFDCKFQSACEGLVLKMGETYLDNKSEQKNLQNRINPLELNDTNDKHLLKTCYNLRQDEGEESALLIDENQVTESILMKTDVDNKDQDICCQITNLFHEKATRQFRETKDEMSNNADSNRKKNTLARGGIVNDKESIYSSIIKTPSQSDVEKSYVLKSERNKLDTSMSRLVTNQKHEVKHFCGITNNPQTELFEIFSGQPDSRENIVPKEQGIIDLIPRKTYGQGKKHSQNNIIIHELKLDNFEIGHAFSDIQTTMTSMSEANTVDNKTETSCSTDAIVQPNNVKLEECLNPSTEIANSKSSSLIYVNCSKKVCKPECNEGDKIIGTSKWDQKWSTKPNQQSNKLQLNYSCSSGNSLKPQKGRVKILEKCEYVCSKSDPFNSKHSVIQKDTQVDYNKLKGQPLVIRYGEKKNNKCERVSPEHSNSSGSAYDTIPSLIPREMSDNLINKEETSLPYKHIPKIFQKCENVPFVHSPNAIKSTEDLSTSNSAIQKAFPRDNTSTTQNLCALKNPSVEENPSATDDASVSKTSLNSQIQTEFSRNQCDLSNKKSRTDNRASEEDRIIVEGEESPISRTKPGYKTKNMDKVRTLMPKSGAKSSFTQEKTKPEMVKISSEKVSSRVPKGGCVNPVRKYKESTGFQQHQFMNTALFGSKFLMHNSSPKYGFQSANINNLLQKCSSLPLSRPLGNICFPTRHPKFSLRLPVNNGCQNTRPFPDHNQQNGFSIPDINYSLQGCSRLPVMNKYQQNYSRLPVNNCQLDCSRFPTNNRTKDCFRFPRNNLTSFTRFPNPQLNDFGLNNTNNCQPVCSRFPPSNCQPKVFGFCSTNPQNSGQFPDNSAQNDFRTSNMNNHQRVYSRFPIINNPNESFRFTRNAPGYNRFSSNHQQHGFQFSNMKNCQSVFSGFPNLNPK